MANQLDELIAETRTLRIQSSGLALALFLLLGFQTFELIKARGNLVTTRAGQEQAAQQSLQLRRQLDALATGTAQLAASGDANAAKIVEDFRRQGVTFSLPAGQRQ
jgi:hypothetical protein